MEAIARGIRRRTVFTVTDSLRLRFTSKVDERADTECWQWCGAQRNGYGCIKHQQYILSAHVVAWAIANSRCPQSGMLICHTCDNRMCCNPLHLYEGTFADNVHDADLRRRYPRPRGMEIPNATLTDDEARLLLALRVIGGFGYRRLARATGFNEHVIDYVIRRKTWKHIPIPSQQEAAAIVNEWKQWS